MFFELEDIRRRRQPTYNQHNSTGWHTAVDSTFSWNFQRGFMIGFVTTYFQQYLSSFINSSKQLAKYYEPPINFQQYRTWFNSVINLESFNKAARDGRQLALFGAVFDMGLKVAIFRQFNSGWQSSFGGFDTSYYRKMASSFLAFIVASPFSVAGDMALRAYKADATFPKELQKGYTSYFNALRRIPFEEGPYYLFRNTAPLYVKHILAPFTAFFSYDWLVDKLSVIWRTTDNPTMPVKYFCAGLSSYLACVFTYPFLFTAKDMVDVWPKKDGVDPWKGNYRKAMVYLWYGPSWNIGWPGMFHRYFWHAFPLYFSTLILADQFGIFSYWRVDVISGAGDNTAEDSYI